MKRREIGILIELKKKKKKGWLFLGLKGKNHTNGVWTSEGTNTTRTKKGKHEKKTATSIWKINYLPSINW